MGRTEQAQLQLLYQAYVEAIENAKRRQWSTVYYTFLSYAAIIGFYLYGRRELGLSCWSQKAFLLLPAFAINVLGMWILVDIQQCLCRYRAFLHAIEESFQGLAQVVLRISPDRKDISDISMKERYFWMLVFPFIILMMIGCFYVVWFINGGRFHPVAIFSLVLLINILFFVCFYLCNVRKVRKYKERLPTLLNSIRTQSRRNNSEQRES